MPEGQTVLGKGPVGAIEGNQRGESPIRGYSEHGAEVIETLQRGRAIQTAVGAGNQLTVRAPAIGAAKKSQGAERAVRRKSEHAAGEIGTALRCSAVKISVSSNRQPSER